MWNQRISTNCIERVIDKLDKPVSSSFWETIIDIQAITVKFERKSTKKPINLEEVQKVKLALALILINLLNFQIKFYSYLNDLTTTNPEIVKENKL